MSTLSTSPDEAVGERATGRLFGLSDAVFAIAMTLLALNLSVPSLGDHPSEGALRHALAEQGPHYLAFLLSFYVTSVYWRRHHAEMRSVRVSHPALVRCTMILLLAVSALPFVANLLGTYGGQAGIVLAVYAGVNVVAIGALLLIRYVVRHHRLSKDPGPRPESLELWFDFAALLLAVPSGFLFPGHGVIALIALLLVSGRAGWFMTRLRRRRRDSAHSPSSGAGPHGRSGG
ncbi:TMEM175 family protein [Streptomyces sp. NBC_01429]|uniref:TMEM175 family protein n=1 Tax=Streptomyces sp. NBC_01429 TaxID=2903862 RepID=UPI002E2991A7|nr:TMEM175 family protein [Streptomyces sp. NBC_01429]